MSGHAAVRPSMPSGLGLRARFALPLVVLALACGKTESPTQTQDPAVATTLTLSVTQISISEQETAQITATVRDQNGATMSGAAVTWRSSDDDVVTVSGGSLTGVEDGTATVTATSGVASATAEVTVLDIPGPFTIDASVDLASVKVGDDLVVVVFAIDAESGEEIDFSVSGGGSCVSVARTGREVTVTALAAGCEEEIVLTAEDQTKTITVRGFDASYLDIGGGLEIGYTNAFQWRWNDVDTDGNHDVTWWHPTPAAADGWYALGSHVQLGYANIHTAGNVPMVMVRDRSASQDRLAAPDSFRVLWTDGGSGGANDGSIWKPICPADFVALGSVVQAGYGPPSTESVRCVAEEHTTLGTVGSWAYDDGGTGARFGDLAVYRVGPSDLGDSPDGKAALDSRAMVGCVAPFGNGYATSWCDTDDFRLLLVPLEVVGSTDDGRAPRLTAQGALQITGARFSSSIRVPFTMLPSEDPTCGTDACTTAGNRVAANVAGSPFYYLERVERYRLLGSPFDCTACTSPGTLIRQLQQCWSETEESSFTKSVGLEVGVEGSASFLGTGGKYSVKLSTELSWTTTSASTYGECTTDSYEASVEPGQIGAFVNVTNEFRARPEAGAPGSLPSVVASFRAAAGVVTYLRWPVD